MFKKLKLYGLTTATKVHLLVGTFLLLTTFSAYLITKQIAQLELKNHLKLHTNQVANWTENRLIHYSHILDGARSFYYTNPQPTGQQWSSYFQTLNLNEAYPDIFAMALIERVPAAQQDQFFRKIASADQSPYLPETISVKTTNSNRSDYYLLRFTDPFRPTQKAIIGLDVEDNPIRAKALAQARDTDRVSITSKIPLESNQQPVFQIIYPLYDLTKPHDSLSSRRANLEGFIVGSFLGEELFSKVISEQVFPGIDFKVYTASSPDPDQLLYDNHADDDVNLTNPVSQTMPIKFKDTTWSITATFTHPASSFAQRLPRLIIIFGTLSSLILTLTSYYLSNWLISRSKR